MTQAEIQLLITARSTAQGTLDDLNKQIAAVTGSAQQGSAALGGMADGTKKVKAGVDDSTQSVIAHNLNLTNFVSKYVEARLTYDTFIQAFQTGVQFVRDSVQFYAMHEAGVSHLLAVERNVPDVLRGNIDAYQALARQLADTTNFTEEEATASIALFSALANVGPESMGVALQAASKLATVLHVDLGTATEDVIRYLDGNTIALKRAGVQIDALVPLTQGAGVALRSLSDKLGDVDTAAKHTTEGSLADATKSFEELEVEVGRVVAPLVVLATKIVDAGEKLKAFEDLIDPGGVLRYAGALDEQGRQAEATAGHDIALASATNVYERAISSVMSAQDREALNIQRDVNLKQILAQQLKTTGDQAYVLVKSYDAMTAAGASTTQITQVLGGAADSVWKSIKDLTAAGVDVGNYLPAGFKAAVDGVKNSGIDIEIKKITDDTAKAAVQAANQGVGATIAGLQADRAAAIRLNAETNSDFTQAKAEQLAIARNYATKIAAAQSAALLQAQIADQDAATQGETAILNATQQGSTAKLQILDVETANTVNKIQQTETNWRVSEARINTVYASAAAQREAIIDEETRSTIDKIIQMDAQREQADIAATERGMQAKIDTLNAQQQLEEEQARRSGMTEDNLQALLSSIDQKYQAQRLQAVVENERQMADERYAVESDAQKELINLNLTGVQAALAANDLELQGKLRDIQLQKDADQQLTADTIALYKAKAAGIIASYDPLHKAWMDLNGDMRQSWADTFDGALNKTTSWKDAVLKPFTDLSDGVKKIFAALLADIEAQFLNPLLGLVKQGIGGLLSGVSGGSTGGGAGGTSAGGVNLGSMFGGGAGQQQLLPNGDVGPVQAGSGGLGYGGAGMLGGVVGGLAVANGSSAGSALGQVGLAAGTTAAAAWATTTATIGSVAALGAATFGIGAAVVGVGLLIKHFTEVSQAELDNRKTVASVQSTIASNLTPAQAAEAKAGVASGAWSDPTAVGTVIAVRDAYDVLGKSASQAEADVKAMWDAEKKGPAAEAAAVKVITDALDAAAKKTADIATGVTDIQTDFGKAGSYIPAAMKNSITALLQMKGLTDDQKASLQALTAQASPSFASMTSMAAGYGITLAGLGPKFEQANLDASAKQIFNDFSELKDNGADVGGVLLGMSDEISKLVQDSIAFGTAIPDNMKPLIQNLADSGKLLDANGNAIKDLTGIKFEDTPIDKGMSDLGTAIQHLTDLLSGNGGVTDAMAKIGPAAQSAAREAKDALNGIQVDPIHIRLAYDDPGLPADAGGGVGDGSGRGGGLPGAASGIFATGVSPVATWFGEGGQPEVGGPKSFFADVFKSLGLGREGAITGRPQGGGGGDTFQFILQGVGVLDGPAFQAFVEQKVLPLITNAVRTNRRQVRTDLVQALGVG